jgi:cell fate regulator YaaT (PSP1 superfamily)
MNAEQGKIALVQLDIGKPLRCFSPSDLAIHEEDLCIVEIDHVLEYGPVLSLETVSSGENTGNLPRLVRRVTLQDQTREKETELMSKMAVEKCTSAAKKHELEIRMVRVRYSFDRQVLTILFSAESRVDFRGMVRDLSTDLGVRVRMQQIGVRDEAGIIGGMGPCGRMMCCAQWLESFESINIRMAKAQRISMNPTAISVMCGRLKCCLRYECDQYQEMDSQLPRDGAKVCCEHGKGCVVDKNILAQRMKIRLEDNRIVDVSSEGVTVDR